MSILSPVAAAIVNNIQASAKPEAKTDAPAFLALLDNGAGNFSAGDNSEQALVDMVAVKAEAPVAQPQAPAANSAEPKQPAAPARQNAKGGEEKGDTKSAAPTAPATRQESAPQKNSKPGANDNANAKEAPRDVQNNAGDGKSLPANQAAAPAAKNEGPEDAALEASLTEKLRGKIEELSNILASLAALLGVGNVVQVTAVKVTQVTLTVSQQNLGVSAPFLDLSDRFDKLIAAITASQNFPGEAGKTLGAAFASFQQLLVSMNNGQGIADASFMMASFSSVQTDLSAAIENAGLAQGDTVDTGQMKDALQKLNQWLADVQTLVAPKTTTVAAHTVIVAAPLQAQVLAAAQSAQTGSGKKEDKLDIIGAAVTSAAATTATQAAAQVNNAPVQNAIAAAIALNSVNGDAGAGANNSGGNGGQGGAQPAPVTSLAGTSAASHTSGMGAPSFSKLLKEQSQTPVSEQVAFNIKTAVKDGASRIQIQLDPVELGKLHIKLDLSSDGKASGIVITAENKATLDLLQRDARGLESALADAGIKADSGSLSFNLQGGNQGNEDAPKSSFAGYPAVVEEEDALAPLAVISRSYVVNTTDGLDIQI